MPLPTIPSGNVNSGLATGYDVANSVRFNDGSSDSLTRSLTGQSVTRTWSLSWWFKRSTLGTVQRMWSSDDDSAGNHDDFFQFNTNDKLTFGFYSSGYYANFETSRVFRDVSSWYHCLFVWDTTQGTSGNRVKVYINGTQETSFGTETYPGENSNSFIGGWSSNNYPLEFGRRGLNGTQYFDGYLAEAVFIQGVALSPTDVGEFDSDSPRIWKPIDVSGLTYANNSFYLKFENSSALGTDSSGNSNTFTVNSLTSIDQSISTPTNIFATLNPLIPNSNITYSEGNLRSVQDGAGDNRISLSTMAVSSGKWYVEHKITQIQDAVHTGIVAADSAYSTSNSLSQMVNAFSYNNDGNVKEYNNSNIDTGEATYTAGDIIGIALDMDNNKVYFHKNGTYINSGNPAGNSNGYSITSGKEYYFAKAMNYAKYTDWNFGSPAFTISSGNADGNGYGNFEYAVPSGFYSLCTKNLAEYG